MFKIFAVELNYNKDSELSVFSKKGWVVKCHEGFRPNRMAKRSDIGGIF